MTASRTLARPLALAAALLGAASIAWATPPRAIPGELIVKYRAGAGAASKAAAMQRLPGAERVRELGLIGADHIRFRGMGLEEAMATIRRDPSVEYVEPNLEWVMDVVPDDARFGELHGMHNTGQSGGTPGADIRATSAWDLFTGDPSLKVGVLDTGVDHLHPDLAANMWTNPGEIPGNQVDDDDNGYIDDVHGYDFANGDGDPFDDNGHGTHCAGTLAGAGDNGIGVAGVVWSARIVAIKFLDAAGHGTTAGAVAGLQYAIAVGCRITNNSWGGGGYSQALLDAIRAAEAADQLFIAAAGNSGSDNDAIPHFPSSYDSPAIIAVAATDADDALWPFSNHGAASVDLGAPGTAILSCKPGGGYQLRTGTSAAAPHVAGAAALARGRFPNATALQIRQLLLLHADPVPALAGQVATGGRLNAFLAIADPDSLPPGAITDLAVAEPGSTTMGLTWTATGDDGGAGRASRYDLRVSASPIDSASFEAAMPVAGPDPVMAGSTQSFEVTGLDYLTPYHFALRALDEYGNAGPVSNLASGTTLGIPDIALSTGAIVEGILAGATSQRTLTVSNAGAGRLDWTTPTPEVGLSAGDAMEAAPSFEDRALGKQEADPRPGMLGAGGPDAFGYRWVDGDAPGGPAFDWADITTAGTSLALTGDDELSLPVAIGFDFPFYGGRFGSVRIATNGFMTFSDTSAPYSNSPLPSGLAAQNMVAPFWDDLDFGATPRVWTHFDGARFIVSWVGVPHYGAGGPYTFQAILYPSGEIRFQYLAIGSPDTSATVGIQDASRTVGLTVAYDTAYVRDSLAVRLLPLTEWLTVTPASGRLAAGASSEVTLRFDASQLPAGTHQALLRFASNDPDEPLLTVPVTLHVVPSLDAPVAPPNAYRLRLASRNPGPRNAVLELSLPERGPADVAVHDIRGALVRRIAEGERAAGVHRLHWDGRDRFGQPAAAGIYFVRARTAAGPLRQRLVVLD